jgi:hypothetical protein
MYDGPTLHELLDSMAGEHHTMSAITSMGHFKMWLREREVQLVGQARAEGEPWDRIADALGRSRDVMDLLYKGRR